MSPKVFHLTTRHMELVVRRWLCQQAHTVKRCLILKGRFFVWYNLAVSLWWLTYTYSSVCPHNLNPDFDEAGASSDSSYAPDGKGNDDRKEGRDENDSGAEVDVRTKKTLPTILWAYPATFDALAAADKV